MIFIDYTSYLFQEVNQMKNYHLYRQLSTLSHVRNLRGGFVYDCETSTQPECRKTEMWQIHSDRSLFDENLTNSQLS